MLKSKPPVNPERLQQTHVTPERLQQGRSASSVMLQGYDSVAKHVFPPQHRVQLLETITGAQYAIELTVEPANEAFL